MATMLPQVTSITRERVSREFDHLGPVACMDEITSDLKKNNPEVLDMILKCSADTAKPDQVVVGLGMFYRLLTAQSGSGPGTRVSMLPCVTAECREAVVRQIDIEGEEQFTLDAIERLDRENSELLQMAHNFATEHDNYLQVMQGFGLIYTAMAIQSTLDRAVLH